MLILHISIAIVSLIWSVLMWVRPSSSKLHAAYGLTAATLASGTYLVVTTHQAMLQSCMTGLLYLGFSLAAIIATRHKLAQN